MATGLEAFGLACNVMQVIQFAGSVISVFKSFHRGQFPDEAITITAEQMQRACQALTESLENAKPTPDKDGIEMLNISQQCLVVAEKLQLELKKFGDSSYYKKSLLSAAKGTFKMILKQRKIDELEKELRAYRETLDNRLLQRIWWVVHLIIHSARRYLSELVPQHHDVVKLRGTISHC